MRPKPQDLKQAHVGVLMGGLSSENEVSMETGTGVLNALAERGYRCTGLEWRRGYPLESLLNSTTVDIVWNALHGTYGEDGAIQGYLRCLGVPFTGSDIHASALAMDKISSKRVFEAEGVSTPEWIVCDQPSERFVLPDGWAFPVVVKPSSDGSSVGVTVVDKAEDLTAAIERAARCPGQVMIEHFIAGQEVHISVLGDRVLGGVEVVPKLGFYDYEAKYKRDDTQYITPPRVDGDIYQQLKDLSWHAHEAIGCEGYSRVDLRIDRAGIGYVLEVNTLPGMTSHSLLPKAAAAADISYGELCEAILQHGWQRG